MNIFYSSTCPIQAARNLDDVRMNKMISESIQMLSIAVFHLYDDPFQYTWGGVPKMFTSPRAFKNHPCSVWVRKSSLHYKWLCDHTRAMLNLRGWMNSNGYKLLNCEDVVDTLSFPSDEWIDPPFAAVDEYPRLPSWRELSPITNYRDYMRWKWRNDTIPVTWKYGKEPQWNS